jgi:hypothetical protein
VLPAETKHQSIFPQTPQKKPFFNFMSTPLSQTTIADGNSPDPEELDTRTEEEVDIPLPERVSHDFDAIDNEPDDEEILQDWKNKEQEPGEDKEDLQHGDEGIDDPIPPTQR